MKYSIRAYDCYLKKRPVWLYARQPDRVLNGLNARQSEIFTEFPPKGFYLFRNVKLAIPKIMLVSWLTKLIQNVFDVCFEMPSDSKNFGCFRACRYHKIARLSTLVIRLPGTVSNK